MRSESNSGQEVGSPSDSSSTPRAYLSRLDDTGLLQVYPITAGEWRIGRNPNLCRVVVPKEFLAAGRIHAQLSCDDTGKCWIENFHTSGTYVNDEAIQWHERRLLCDGDIISLAGPRASGPTWCVYTLTRRPLELHVPPTYDGMMAENGTVLVLMSNPAGTGPLHLDVELRAIDQSILSAKYRDQIDLHQSVALRISDLDKAVIRYTPSIVHFSGHGSRESEIILADDSGNAVPVPSLALSNFFQVMAPPVRCVILNACFTDRQSQAIAQHVDCVIGMSRAISDVAAITFSEAFYYAIASGLPIGKAFRLGQIAMERQFPRDGEHATPVFLSRHGADRLCFTS